MKQHSSLVLPLLQNLATRRCPFHCYIPVPQKRRSTISSTPPQPSQNTPESLLLYLLPNIINRARGKRPQLTHYQPGGSPPAHLRPAGKDTAVYSILPKSVSFLSISPLYLSTKPYITHFTSKWHRWSCDERAWKGAFHALGSRSGWS